MSSPPSSRPSMHKSTDGKPGRRGVLRAKAKSTPLTERGASLRRECVGPGGGPVDWRTVVHRWRSAVNDNRDNWAKFENEADEEVVAELTDRFSPKRHKKRYAQLKDLSRRIEREWGRVHTVMLTLTASSTDEDGEPRPPVDHLEDLDESKDAVNSALSRVLDGMQWERVVIPEQHESGYVHWHWAVFVNGPVSAGDFQPVLDSHVGNCPSAGRDAHRADPPGDSEGAVSVRSGVDNLAAYLTSYMLSADEEFSQDPLDASEERQMMLALLWATNKRYWRPSDGAQFWMRHEPDEELTVGGWELVGISTDGLTGEYKTVSPSAGGVDMVEVFPPPD